MAIVTLYRVSSGYSNVPDGISLVDPGSDTRMWERDYILPEGYEVAENIYGEQMIFDPAGKGCKPCLTSNSANARVMLSGCDEPISLKRAGTDGADLSTFKRLRKQAGLTQLQLAEAAGLNIRQLQKYELGECELGNMSLRNALGIADALKLDPHELI